MNKSILYPGYVSLKQLLLAAIITIGSNNSFAQADSLPVYRQFPNIPPFKLMVLPDSTAFVKHDLEKKRPVIVMVFSPDCDHCKHAVEDLLQHAALFKKVQIVMASSLGYNYIRKFYEEYKLADYDNIKVGYDAQYFLVTFFGLRSYPSVYVYDKKGKLKANFEGSVNWEKVAEVL